MTKHRRLAALMGLFAIGAFVLGACQPQPQPPPPPAARALRFDVTRAGPIVIGSDANDNPVPLTDTPPDVFVLSAVDGCDPLDEYGSLQVARGPWTAPDGTVYDAWLLTGGSQFVNVPGDAKCLPSKGSTYILAGVGETLNNDGTLNGKATGIAVDQDGPSAPAWVPLFKIVK